MIFQMDCKVIGVYDVCILLIVWLKSDFLYKVELRYNYIRRNQYECQLKIFYLCKILFFYSTTSKKFVIILRKARRQVQQDVSPKMEETFSGLTGRKPTCGIRDATPVIATSV